MTSAICRSASRSRKPDGAQPASATSSCSPRPPTNSQLKECDREAARSTCIEPSLITSALNAIQGNQREPLPTFESGAQRAVAGATASNKEWVMW